METRAPHCQVKKKFPPKMLKHPSLLRRAKKATKGGAYALPAEWKFPCTAMFSELASVLGSALSMG